MEDQRLRLKRKYVCMSPVEWQIAQTEEKTGTTPPSKLARIECSDKAGRAASDRSRFTPRDLQTPFESEEQVNEWCKRFPCLLQRNYYVVQYHYATRNHFDLRLQLDNQTMSWAIPRTLSDPADRPFRYAIETIPHDLAYTLLEGSVVTGRSTTGCWDLGTYTIHETKSKEEPKQKLRDKGWNDSETEPREQESPYQEDLRQEDLFRDAYHRSAFLPVPAVEGRPGMGQTEDNGFHRGFVIELNGERFRGLRILAFRKSSDFKKPSRPVGSDPHAIAEQHREYLFRLHVPSNDPADLAATERHLSTPPRSILTNRTMDEIRRDSVAWIAKAVGYDLDGDGDEETVTDSAGASKEGLEGAVRRWLNSSATNRASRGDSKVVAEKVEAMLAARGGGEDEEKGIFEGEREEERKLDAWGVHLQLHGWPQTGRKGGGGTGNSPMRP